MGKCQQCGEWDTLISHNNGTTKTTNNAAANFVATVDQFGDESVAIKLLDIETPEIGRASTGISELNRVLGGGLVVGSVVLRYRLSRVVQFWFA